MTELMTNLPFLSRLLLNLGHPRHRLAQHMLIDRHRHGKLKQVAPPPVELRFFRRRRRGGAREGEEDEPEFFGLEGFDLGVAGDYEAESGELAGSCA